MTTTTRSTATSERPIHVALWSYNYAPEPSGIAPLSAVWAHAMQRRGHRVTVVAAHPHYPTAIWGRRWRPYAERRDGVRILRLPIWDGREGAVQRMRQEASHVAALSLAAPLFERPDALVAVTPSFPGLLPAIAFSRAHGVPLVMWLQDILPDGAATTGLVKPGRLLDAARRFERVAYASAAKVVVISDAFERNLLAKRVPPGKMVRIYNPAATDIAPFVPPPRVAHRLRLLCMGNVGHSQGLAGVVRALERSGVLAAVDAEFRIAGHGVAADDVANEIQSDRVRMLGLLLGSDMEAELAGTHVGVVTQRSDVTEFNLPSKLMNYMGHGVPVLAVVNPASETARIVRENDAGWVVDSSDLSGLAAALADIARDPEARVRKARSSYLGAATHFSPDGIAAQYEQVLREVGAGRTQG